MTDAAPPADAFASWPAGWTILGRSRDFSRTPAARERFGHRLVVYRTTAGMLAAMDARCWHLGADLAAGDVVGDCVRCPFHGWQFDADGQCASVPTARQQTFATAERDGLAFAFPDSVAAFPLPWFDDVGPLVAARPFEFRIRCPWFLVGTNGFDLQHFAGAHDRRLLAPPTIDSPHPFARRITATFAIVGDAWRDRLTRAVAGDRVTMSATVWAGTLAFVSATFARGTTYGLAEIRPLSAAETFVRVRIFVRRRPHAQIEANVRANFVRDFLRPDAQLLNVARYDPTRLIDADRVMIDYLRWLAPLSHATSKETT